MLILGDQFPNFTATSTEGDIVFHEWLANSWGILFSHPADFTPVCTTELGRLVTLKPEFEKRNVKIIAMSCDDLESHEGWMKDILWKANCKENRLPYPIIADKNRELAIRLGMIDMDEKNAAGIPLSARGVFIVDHNKKLRLSVLYPATTGRNFDEILRVVDSMQLTDKHKIATPADWKVGDNVMLQPSITAEEAKKLFPNTIIADLPSKKPYLRETEQP